MKNSLDDLFLQSPAGDEKSSVTGRLLSEIEIDSVMGGNGQSHSQTGGSYNQSGGDYSQHCDSCSYNQAGGGGGG